MAYPRYLQVPPNAAGTYHCVSRCVRRAFLCGDDVVTGRGFEHRKEWVEKRIIELASVFSVAVNAYAVMSNHFHLVIETDPNAPGFWSDDEVARRWLNGQGVPCTQANVALLRVVRRRSFGVSGCGSNNGFSRCLRRKATTAGPSARLKHWLSARGSLV